MFSGILEPQILVKMTVTLGNDRPTEKASSSAGRSRVMANRTSASASPLKGSGRQVVMVETTTAETDDGGRAASTFRRRTPSVS